MNKLLGYICCFVGIALFIHSVLSVIQHKSYLRLTNKPFEHIPYDIAAESIIALVIASYGIINVAPKLTTIKINSHLSKRERRQFINHNLAMYTSSSSSSSSS
ncbi:putative transmembrane protein [Cavenderia fasciculata]|uniref:Transmembrane protein n=1 Tax=Cavenderia fasciculata TaxID=261658 RepID=F4PYB5_CACFS|nr:putative transmembrane protein [Cavenderia fasciculata]EGG19382.1 putative transmembrane protein [Cavenderia fasciculata]|eukprot:XP_004357653.1 putative transmembrane protein [Cavenderia fasciculata]